MAALDGEYPVVCLILVQGALDPLLDELLLTAGADYVTEGCLIFLLKQGEIDIVCFTREGLEAALAWVSSHYFLPEQ